jgi:hypothetical protein
MFIDLRYPGAAVPEARLHGILHSSGSVRGERNHRSMWQVTVVCSSCAEENEVVVEDLDRLDEVCGCGYDYVVLSVATFEAVEVAGGQLVQMRRRRDDLSLAA